MKRKQRAAIRELAARRVQAAWSCVNVLRPDLSLADRKALATKVLDLCRRDTPPPVRITAAQVQEIVWRNSQCANRYCSMVLFSREIAEEINGLFEHNE